ncbi:MAG TPA: hypothetical protein VH083_09365 [Myxococcales bacterium]|jgi:hypothetical protein|nr:hypothetical protein [Myxococcales bacterium]
MKRLLIACFLLAGCIATGKKDFFAKQRFTKLDQGYEPTSRAEPPRVFVDADEMVKEKSPPYRFIGVVEVENIQTEELSIFYERVAKAGQAVGCEAMLQRDAFRGVALPPLPLTLKPDAQSMGGKAVGVSSGSGFSAAGSYTAGGGGVYHNNMAIWQFLCGVGGANQEQAEVSFKKADALAVKMRVAVLGFEPCAPFTPLGSHIHKTHVCADDPHGRNRPDSTSFDR